MKNIVQVTGIEVFAYHGCMDEEAVLGGKFSVDISILTDFSKSGASDELIDTIDYVRIREIVVEQMAIRSKLIEHVAYRILTVFKKEFPSAIENKITIRKLNAPIGGVVDEVAIIVEG